MMALSSMEAEYRDGIVAACKAIWLKRVMKDLNELVNKPILVHCENLNNIQLAKSLMFHAWTKRFEVQYHHVQEHILAEDFDLHYIKTTWYVKLGGEYKYKDEGAHEKSIPLDRKKSETGTDKGRRHI